MMNFQIDSKSIEDDFIQFKSRSKSDPTLSDIDIKNKMAWVWTALKKYRPFKLLRESICGLEYNSNFVSSG